MASSSPPAQDSVNLVNEKEKEVPESSVITLVDPFLKEALQNPRHRLTILRMELDVQSFMQTPDQQLFEFPHFPTSYLRLAAHRVAQHYGLQSMVADNVADSLKTRIVAKKTPESKLPYIRLSEVPTEQQPPQVEKENDKLEQVKISIKQRCQNSGLNGANGGGAKNSTLKTMEERKEEYDRARARIFNSSSSSSFDSDDMSDSLSQTYILSRENSFNEPDKGRVAIIRDREKDRSDPDYDRSYDRYVRGLPANQSFNLGIYNAQNYQPAYVQYDTGFAQHGVLPRTQASAGYAPSNHMMNPFCAVGSNQTSGDSLYVQCPSLAMMYTHSYEQVRHAVFQAPIYHQPLCYTYTQNY